ncbi:hypothetical protein CSB09_02135 [Candidatus Gracilibacteria bacterium]|nr:MAG: hypothetical protein CSB09_02135 [Candidatus Gracilibacteria bacterium]
MLLYVLTIHYKSYLNPVLAKYILFPLIVIIIHYAFFYLIFRLIRYYNNLILLKKDAMFIVKTSLIEFDNIELIELDKITKIDTQMKGIIQNLLSYGTLIIEQNRDRVREFHYIYKPYKAVRHLKEIKKQQQKSNSAL